MKSCPCYFGYGKVYLSPTPLTSGWGYDYGAGYGGEQAAYHVGRPLGNSTELTVNIDYPEDSSLDLDIPYKDNCFDPNAVTINLNLSCISAPNTSLAFLGRHEDVLITDVGEIDQPVVPLAGSSIQEGDFIEFNHPIVDPLSVVVKRDDTLDVLTLGADYVVDKTGITMLVGFNSSIGLIMTYNYNNQQYTSIQSLVNPRQVYGLFFKGRNAMNQDHKLVKFFRVKFDPVSTWSYIGGSILTIPLTARVLPVPYSGSGLSDYFIERTIYA